MSDSRPLLRNDKTFWGLLITQFLGAFNDNVFKFVVMFLCTDRAKANPLDDWQGYALIAFASPFVLFSGVCGFLGDRFSKTRIIVVSKFLEILIMGAGLLVFWFTEPSRFQLVLLIMMLFLMGAHSTLFGPAKYGILPELYSKNQLPGINGWFLMTTFVAIIGGVAAAGALKDALPNLVYVQWICVLIAIAGALTSLMIRQLPAADPTLKLNPSSLFIDPETRLSFRQLPSLFVALIYSSVFWFVGGIFQPSVNAMGKLQYQLSDSATGQLAATTAIGIAIGSVLAGYLSRSRFRAGLVRVAAVGMVICMAALAIPGEKLKVVQPIPPKPVPASARTGNWAEMMLSEREYNFGAAAQGSNVEHVIEIKNLYKEPVTIRAIKSSCGCLDAFLDKTVIESKDVAHLSLNLNTTRYSKQRETTITIEAAWDGDQVKQVHIPVSAYIRTDVSVQPSSIQFGTVTAGKASERQVLIQYVGRNNWTIRSAKSTNPYVLTDLREVLRESGSVDYRLTAKIDSQAPNGPVDGQVILETDDDKNSTFRINFKGVMEGSHTLVADTANPSNNHVRLPYVSLTGAALLLVGAGLFAGLFSVPLQVYIQAMAPEHLKGRMIGAMNLINWIGIVLSGAFYGISSQIFVRVGASPNAIFGAIAIVILIAAVAFPMRDESLESSSPLKTDH